MPNIQERWLVLVGGGGMGRWQSGALYALEQAGVLAGISGIVGTSVGGMNACVLGMGIAKGTGAIELKKAWDGIQKNTDVYTPDLGATAEHPWAHPIDCAAMTHGFLFGPSTVSTEPLANFVEKTLGDWSTEKILMAGGPVVLVRAYHYETHKATTLCGDLVPMALATSAIEGVFPRRWGYGDGGAVDNEPIGVALKRGAKQILVVYCGPEAPEDNENPSPTLMFKDTPDPKTSTGLKDALAIVQGITTQNEAMADEAAGRAEQDGAQIVYCFPPSDTGSALDFSERGLWDRGVKEAQKAIEDAKKLGWI